MSARITSRTTLDNLKREARRWLKALRANDEAARVRLLRVLPDAPAAPTLRDIQRAVALEHGLPGWLALKSRLAPNSLMRRYDEVADALVTAYRTGETDAMRIVWDYFGHGRTWEVMRRYVRLGLGKTESPAADEEDTLTLEEAQFCVARAQEFESWKALTAFIVSVPAERTFTSKAVGLTSSGDPEAASPDARSRDWDEVVELVHDRGWRGLHACGQMTDAILERIAGALQLTTLDLGGSKGVSDAGMRHLAGLPNLRHLNLAGCRITDRGLDVLRQLPHLETLNVAWTAIGDTGAAHLTHCDRLKKVDLSGTSTGDGAIRALAGKSSLIDFRSGTGVTDAGLPMLHELPAFRTWQEAPMEMALLRPDARPNFLMLRGSFTNAGMARLVGLDGLFALDVDSADLAITGAALAPLVALPHLAWLAFDAKDESMPHIADLPHLRFLMCQDTSAGDDGFAALSRSQSIEHIWGRRCYNLKRRGFMALADMPRLRYLSVSCRNVDDEGLAALPRFPALRELMPMDVPDGGYRHVGRCAGLESLVLMYCRDTTDRATEHIASLPALVKYFASYNRITDRTPVILSGMPSLEEITFDTCTQLTDIGVSALARLPRLRHLRLSGMPRVTADVVAGFPTHVTISRTI